MKWRELYKEVAPTKMGMQSWKIEREENTRTHCKEIILDQYMNNLSSDLPDEGFYVEFMSLTLII